jgi:hypothetical protein
MNDRDRLRRMRALRDHLERLPASEQRDRVLREVAGRAVDIESGAPERPLTAEPAPPQSAAPTPERARPARRAPATTRRPDARGQAGRVRARADAADAFTASVRATPGLPEGLRLSLDDDAPTPADRPWTRGLRG